MKTHTLAFCLLFMGASASHATVIDFQSLEQADDQIHSQGFSYSEDGYTLNNLANTSPFATYGTKLDNLYPGSTALFNNTIGGVTELVKDGGGLFNLLSIDLAELNPLSDSNTPNKASVTFMGQLSGGGTVSQTFTLDGIGPANGLETFQFSGFDNLLSVTWGQDTPFHQFDNIVVEAVTTTGPGTDVPEPETLALFALGVAALAYVRRKTKSAKS